MKTHEWTFAKVGATVHDNIFEVLIAGSLSFLYSWLPIALFYMHRGTSHIGSCWHIFSVQAAGNNTNVRHSDMADKMSLKSEKLPNLPDKMSDKCYGTKIVMSHHQKLVFCLNKTIQTTFHYGRKWRLLTVMACLIRNAVFKLFKSVHTHATILQSCQSKCLP